MKLLVAILSLLVGFHVFGFHVFAAPIPTDSKDILLISSDHFEEPYVWQKASCTRRNTELQIILESQEPEKGRLNITLPLEGMNKKQEGKPFLNFVDWLETSWRVDFSSDRSYCEWLIQGDKDPVTITLKCFFLIDKDITTRRWVKIPATHPIVCNWEKENS